jgi:CelD/BcsL family acetyltransferase involved in cellulose biosynthesis
MTAVDAREWRTLAASALVPAPGASPAWAEPVLKHFSARKLTLARNISGAPTGVALIERRLFPWPLRQSLGTPLSFQGVPLLAREDASDALRELVGKGPLLLRGIPADGPFWDIVKISGLKAGVVNTWQRAALKAEDDFERWFETNFERKRRKEFRRLMARLGEVGRLETLAWTPGEAIDPWAEEFLALEAKGWKGKRGTALASNPATAASLREVLRNLSEEGSLRFWKLSLDGHAVAMLFATVMGGTAWLGKIAHDETYAKYSPGVLMILAATQALMADPAVNLADSCAQPGHPMIDHLWRDRVRMADVLLAPAGFPAFGALAAAERARANARRVARGLYVKVLGRKSS